AAQWFDQPTYSTAGEGRGEFPRRPQRRGEPCRWLTPRRCHPGPDACASGQPGLPSRPDAMKHMGKGGVTMRRHVIIAAAGLGALAVAGCGSSGSSSSSSATGGTGTTTTSCVASIGMEGPLTGPVATLGQEQLHFAQLALAMDNTANKTKISLVQGDTQLTPS